MAGWKLRKDKAQPEAAGTETAEDGAPTPETDSLTPGSETHALPAAEDAADAAPVSHWEMPEEDWHTPAEAIALPPVEDEPETPVEVEHPAAHVVDLSGEPLTTPDDFVLVDVPPLEAPPLEAPHAEAPDLETPEHPAEDDEALHFAEDEDAVDEDALVLVDYSAPAPPEAPAAAEGAAIPLPSSEGTAPQPPASEPLPLPPTTAPATPEAEDITSTLRMDRSELAAFAAPLAGGTIPPVAPFVMDAPPAAVPAGAAHRLVMHLGRLSAAFDLTKDVTAIGRPDSALHYYPDVEIELDDAVSRRHAEVLHRDGAYFVVDTGSTNGTMLNGELLPPHEERELAHGDRIRVGERTELIFE